MQELGITQYGLAKTIGVPPIRVHAIVNRRRSITADTTYRVEVRARNSLQPPEFGHWAMVDPVTPLESTLPRRRRPSNTH